LLLASLELSKRSKFLTIIEKTRHMQTEKYYHIYNHANGRDNLFISVENYEYFLRQWTKYINPIANTLANCLMPNHFHCLVLIKDQEEIEASFGKFETFQKLEYRLSKQFASLFSSYTQAFNKRHNRKGSLFAPNFKKKEITSNDYISKVIAYIHTNPIHHRFVQNIKDWRFSSYQSILSDKPTQVNRQEVLNWFGGKNAFEDFHQSYINTLPSE